VKKFFRFCLWLIGILITIVLLVFIAFQVSPRPGAYLIGHMFNQEVTITDPDAYDKSLSQISVKNDLTYDSDYDRSTFDIYYPKDTTEAVPVVFWVHGGGYVGGDKEGTKEFAAYLADQGQVAVVSLNYEWAPSLEYPGQVKQINQAYQSIKKDADKYPMLDFNRVIFGGDSAGSQIAGQFLAIQTNSDYAKDMQMEQVIPAKDIKGFISYCGPVDLKQMAHQSSDDRFMKFFVKTVAWSLLGTKDWKNSSELQQVSLVDKLTKDFPPTYITDGNAFSFQDQGIAFDQQLTELGVPVQSLFYKDVEKEVTHEYQFDYSMEESQTCFDQTLDFLKNVMLK
jgi:acetyl esterase